MKKKAIVAMSGGLDSSVTALLLKQQGYEVVGVTGKMLDTPCSQIVCDNAKAVADKLDIEHYVIDATKIFKEKVVDYFENSYSSGKTPNPCIQCNKFVKWGEVFDYSMEKFGADIFATGHYADVRNVDGIYKLYPAKDTKKDQLYFLFQLTQEQLSKTLFPLYSYQKSEIREIAIQNNLPSKSSKESQDICFIQKPNTTKKYLLDRFPAKQGDFIELSTGKKLGIHNGHFQYTIGQRKGIGIAAPEPLYVVDIDAKNNIVYLGKKDDTLCDTLTLDTLDYSYPFESNRFKANVKIRYNMQPAEANILIEDKVKIIFSKPISAIAKGQACVLYNIDDGHLLGGSFI